MKRCMRLLPVLALLAACANTAKREEGPTTRDTYLEYAGDSVSQMSYQGRISGWHPLSRDELVVWTTGNRAYLLTVVPACMGLEFATQISISSRIGNWVTSGMDEVRAGRDRCRITDIRPIDYGRMRADQREQSAAD